MPRMRGRHATGRPPTPDPALQSPRRASGGSLRLFFALWPDANARATLSQVARDVAGAGRGRAVPESNLHVTLAFLGATADSRVSALRVIGSDVARPIASFGLAMESVSGRAHGVHWIAAPSVPDALVSLHAALTRALDAEGFPVERRGFRPHVTLARNCALPASRARIAPIGWIVDRLALIASTPAAGGSMYRTLDSWALRKIA